MCKRRAAKNLQNFPKARNIRSKPPEPTSQEISTPRVVLAGLPQLQPQSHEIRAKESSGVILHVAGNSTLRGVVDRPIASGPFLNPLARGSRLEQTYICPLSKTYWLASILQYCQPSTQDMPRLTTKEVKYSIDLRDNTKFMNPS